jgi:hypothetical protein
MSLAEIAAAFVTAFLALVAIVAYLVDAAGYGVMPSVALGVAAVVSGAAALSCLRSRYFVRGNSDLIVWLGIVVLVTAALLRVSWPSLVPPGRGPDLTHHLLLVDYIEQQRHLVHDRSLDGAMGEMAHYTPGAHLLAVIAGASLGADGMHAFFPIAVLAAALTAAFVFLIGRRHGLSVPYAISGAVLLLLPAQYFAGAFTHDSFLAQAVSTLFTVAMWWALMNWDDRPGVLNASIVAVFLAAVFLAWPIWLGPLLLVFLALVLRADLSSRERQVYLAIVLLPFLAIALLHSWDRWGWMVIVRTSGAVLHPSLDSLGWLLPLLAVIGALAAMREPRARISVALLLVTGLQMLTLFVLAKAQGAHTPYMAFKMVYLAIYPMAVLAAIGIARLAGAARVPESAGWLVAAALLIGAVQPALNAPRAVAVVSDDLYSAGKWVRAHGGAACADYLVADAETAYWLHLAVLGNPRASERMKEVDRYDPRTAAGPWITSEGRDYAIADLRLLPAEIRSRVDLAAQFGSAAVIKRRDATIKGCD